MAAKATKIGFFIVTLTAVLASRAAAQSGCTNVLLGMAPCLNYVTGTSSTPSSSCCSILGSVVQSQPQCLCFALGGGAASLGITINQTLHSPSLLLAMSKLRLLATAIVILPQVLPFYCCAPVASPAVPPVGSPESVQIDSSSSLNSSPFSGAGSKTSPSVSADSTTRVQLAGVAISDVVGVFKGHNLSKTPKIRDSRKHELTWACERRTPCVW
ncbi:Bifunctional inhibitor/plant lipid transfer protein/seed storage helical domain [Dillenia turbinata]|uniref:Bifunctional inhibitor/plant lipid transfer protein/seed storage helical domain n=1 Tax=Dillenia turbinata TaxID=194707 RepID=A0AAN8V985_9MAGN